MRPPKATRQLLPVLALVAVRSIIVGAVIAAGIAWLTSIGFWSAFAVTALALCVRGGVQWVKAVRDLRSYLADRRSEWMDDDGDSDGGSREPRRPVGPRPGLRSAADPDESTGPSAIP